MGVGDRPSSGFKRQGRPSTKPKPELAADRPAYDRQPFEIDRAWEAFRAYRDMPMPRPTLAEFGQAIGVAKGSIHNWSSRHSWPLRCDAWDRSIAEDARGAIVAEVVAEAGTIAKRQLEYSAMLGELVKAELTKMLHQSRGSQDMIVTPKTLLQMMAFGVKLDHLLGEPEEGGTDPDAPDLSRLDTADLVALRNLARKASEGK